MQSGDAQQADLIPLQFCVHWLTDWLTASLISITAAKPVLKYRNMHWPSKLMPPIDLASEWPHSVAAVEFKFGAPQCLYTSHFNFQHMPFVILNWILLYPDWGSITMIQDEDQLQDPQTQPRDPMTQSEDPSYDPLIHSEDTYSNQSWQCAKFRGSGDVWYVRSLGYLTPILSMFCLIDFNQNQ